MTIQRKVILGVQIFILCLLIQASNSISFPMTDLQSIVKQDFCLCGQKRKCTESIRYIAGLPQTGYWDLDKNPITDNKNNIPSMTFQVVRTNKNFEFPNTQLSGTRKVSGLLATPDMKGPLKGLVIYFHGTFFSKNQAPSNIYYLYKAIGAIFGAKKYAVLFPDYLGYGDDKQNVHPYVLYPQQNVLSAIYLLNQVVSTLNSKYGNINPQNPLPVLSNGYSQGGAYSVFFGACISRNLPYCNVPLSESYKVAAITGSEGAYDTQLVKNFLTEEVTLSSFDSNSLAAVNAAKPGLSALAIYSFATYNPSPFSLQEAFVPDYYNMKCTGIGSNQKQCNVGDKQMNIKQVLSLTNGGSGNILTAILNSALGKSNNGYTYVRSLGLLALDPKNSIYSLVNKNVVFNSNFDSAIRDSTMSGSLPYPTFLFSLTKDSFVSPLNTRSLLATSNARSYFLENHNFQVCTLNTTILQPADHLGAYIVSHLFVLNFFESVLNGQKRIPTQDL